MQSFMVGVDIGGTFTDCVVIDEKGEVTSVKSPSTPENFAQGMISAVSYAAEKLGMEAEELFRRTTMLSHGTTVGTNAVIQKRGARVGLITTRGHNDVIHIMRGSRGFGGRDMQKVIHFPEGRKPEPIIPKRLIRGVSERVDCFGEVVVELNEDEAAEAIRALVAEGVEAISICFLWSFLNPAHERRVRDMARELAPGVFVTCSADLAPKWGEYERTTAVALNGYIGPITAGYLERLSMQLSGFGYGNPLQITQCAGGTISVDHAMQAPLLTLDSGPVAGVMGSVHLGAMMDIENIITTDMGGTSFDVGIIFEGRPVNSFVSTVNQYEYFIPKVDIQAIGAGGGSLARVDELTGTLRVGPDSAGAAPGPICYGRGGATPTVTDAALVLGYYDPEGFAGGRMTLDKPAAEAAIAALGKPLGLDLMQTASGIAKIAELQMADTIRKMTVGKGFDPRDFALFAFGGAGPVHAGVFARELGVRKVIVPQRETASTWCAFGAASADVLHVHEQVSIMTSPFSGDRINEILERLEREARAEMAREGIAEARQKLLFSLDMRHKGQINEVEVALDASRVGTGFEGSLAQAFYDRYERLYGRGASFRGARLEIVTFRVRATAEIPRPRLSRAETLTEAVPDAARRRPREVWFEESGGFVSAEVWDGLALLNGNVVAGPALVETTDTVVVVRPGQSLLVDAFGNFELNLHAEVDGHA